MQWNKIFTSTDFQISRLPSFGSAASGMRGLSAVVDLFFGRPVVKWKAKQNEEESRERKMYHFDGVVATEVDLPWNGKNIIRYTWFHLTFLASLRCCFSAVVLRFFCELLRLYYPVTSDYTFASERFRLYSEMDFRLSSPTPFSAIKHWICNQHFSRSRRSLAIKLPSIRCFILGRSVLAHSRASSVAMNSEMRLSGAEEKLYYIWPCIIN